MKHKTIGIRVDGGGGSVLLDIMKGALAGAIGVWAMDKAAWALWNRQSRASLRQEEAARPEGLDPAHVIANRSARALGMSLSPKQPHPAGIAVHYALGVLPAAIYAVARHRGVMRKPGYGALFGLAAFVLEDELLNPLLGTSGGPTEYPWQAHLRGLVGHLVYGSATEASLAFLDDAT